MDIVDKVTKGAGDLVAKARERERVRLEDRLRQLDRLEAAARTMTVEGKRRAGYTWDEPVEQARHSMIAAAATIGDDQLTLAVDELVTIDIPYGEGATSHLAPLDRGFRLVVKRLAEIRRETLADD